MTANPRDSGSWQFGEQLDELLSAHSCKALLVIAQSSKDPCLAPFCGPGRLANSFLLAPQGQPPRLGFLTPMERGEAARSGLELLSPEDLDVARWARDSKNAGEMWAHVLERACQLVGLSAGQVAIAGSVPVGRMLSTADHLRAQGWCFCAGEEMVELLRKRKSQEDRAAIRQAAAGGEQAIRRVGSMLASADIKDGELWLGQQPLRVATLRSEVATCLAALELEQPEGNIIAPAEEGALPHSMGSDQRVLRAGESLVVDLFPRGRLFADMTRTFCVGPPPEALAQAHAEVEKALELAAANARPGLRGWHLQTVVCQHLAAAEYPTPISHPGTERGYVHGLGHGIGYELHELPTFAEHASDALGSLAEGDVITLEPGLYEPEAGWAVRLEDLYRVSASEVERLTPMPRRLDPATW